MWPLPKLENDLISFSFSPNNLACSWIQKNSNSPIPFRYTAYERHELLNLELIKLTIFNPTRIQQIITSFLSRHNTHNAFITFSMSGQGITEQYIALPTTTPHATDFGITHSSNMLWGYRFMYNDHDGQSIFYLYKIPRALILQYQLIAIAAQLNLIAITTQQISLFNSYKNLHNNAFRQSQYALDMINTNNAIEKSISIEDLKKAISVPSNINITDELSYLATAYGLFTCQGLKL